MYLTLTLPYVSTGDLVSVQYSGDGYGLWSTLSTVWVSAEINSVPIHQLVSVKN